MPEGAREAGRGVAAGARVRLRTRASARGQLQKVVDSARRGGTSAASGPMAEWLRRGLQILARRFDSGSGLHPECRFSRRAAHFFKMNGSDRSKADP